MNNIVVQFNENHKWCGAFGIITETKVCGEDIRFMIGVPMLGKGNRVNGTAYIYSMQKDKEFDIIGKTNLIPSNKEEE